MWERLGDIVVLPITSFKDPIWNSIKAELWHTVAKLIGTNRLARQKIRDMEGRGVLHAAAVKGRTNICRYLLEELKFHSDEKDEEDCTPLLHASLEGNLSTVECLIENGADPAALNKHSTTALHLAALEGHVEVIHFLLSKGADVNAPSAIGTPLQVASQLCDSATIKTFLDNGAEDQ